MEKIFWIILLLTPLIIVLFIAIVLIYNALKNWYLVILSILLVFVMAWMVYLGIDTLVVFYLQYLKFK